MLNSCNCLRLSKAGQEYNLLNICSCGHSFLQQAKRKIQWNRWPKIRTNLEVSNHLVSYSDLKIPHKLSQFKYMFDYMLLSHSVFTVSFHLNVCRRLAKGQNRQHSLDKLTLTNGSSYFKFFSATQFAWFYCSPTPQ